MAPSAHRIAREYLLGHLRQADQRPGEDPQKGPGKIWTTDAGRTRAQRAPGVFQSFTGPDAKTKAEAWLAGTDAPQDDEGAQGQGVQQPDEGIDKFKEGPHSEVALKTLDTARNGKEVNRETNSAGGEGLSSDEKQKIKGQNPSYIVELEHNGKREKFVFKPAEGEQEGLSLSVPGGSYHQREQAAYGFDALVGGRTIVPPTVTKGEKSGSFQAFSEGAKDINDDETLREIIDKVPLEELVKNPDFERLNVMDLIMGHEDRHRGNIMVRFEGEEKPENLRLVAIDNGIAMGGKLPNAKNYGYRNTFEQWTNTKGFSSQDTGAQDAAPSEGTVKLDKTKKIEEGTRKVEEGTPRLDDNMPSSEEINQAYAEQRREAKDKGQEAVKGALTNISPELHKQIKAVKLTDAVKSMADAGLRDPGAVRGQMVRLAAMQADPKIFQKVLEQNDNDLDQAWRSFQHMSHGDELLKLAGASDKAGEIDKALKSNAPEGGWDPPEKAEKRVKEYLDKMEAEKKKLESWGSTPTPPKRSPGAPQRTEPIHEDPEAKKEDGKGVEFDQWGTAKMSRVKDRWLRQAICSARLQKKS